MTAFSPDRSDAWRALGLLVAGMLLVAAVLYLPILRPWWQVESRLWTLRKTIAASQSIQSKAPNIDLALTVAREHALASGRYMSEQNAALANAALTLRVQDAVNASSTEDGVCLLGNRAPVSLDNHDHCVEARIKVDLQCGIASLEQVLRALETQPPRLRIDHLDLSLAPNPLGFDKPSDGKQPLRVSMDVAGCLFPSSLAGGDQSIVGSP